MSQLIFQLVVIALFAFSLAQAQSQGELAIGISELQYKKHPHNLVSSDVRLLVTSADQQSFLRELEGEIPDWSRLYDHPNEEIGERLFVFNRNRDHVREGHPLLKQRIAFLWSGLLRRYISKHQGFTVAMGPDFTETVWGIVRFKPVRMPHEMIAVPPADLRASLQHQLAKGEAVEIKILFTGRLVPDESIIYAFSHEDPTQGMIIPVVQTEAVQYILESFD